LSLGDIDYDYFTQKIKPVLLRRVPSFKNLKLIQAWAGYYDYNTFDQNLIIGRHYLHRNFIFANGSSGHGLQHAAAIGRAVAELVLKDKYETIDLSRFSFERVVLNLPVREIDVV
jgi:FAD-dependent oxidoreductase domain-containing protein 1